MKIRKYDSLFLKEVETPILAPNGEIYERKYLKYMAAHYDIPLCIIGDRIREGLTLEEAVSFDTFKKYKPVYDHTGKEYKSLRSMCNYYSLNPTTVSYKLNYRKNYKLIYALKPIDVDKLYKINTEIYKEPLSFPYYDIERVLNRKYENYNGEVFDNLNDLYKNTEIDYDFSHLVDHKGTEYTSLEDLLYENGISYDTFIRRLCLGYKTEYLLKSELWDYDVRFPIDNIPKFVYIRDEYNNSGVTAENYHPKLTSNKYESDAVDYLGNEFETVQDMCKFHEVDPLYFFTLYYDRDYVYDMFEILTQTNVETLQRSKEGNVAAKYMRTVSFGIYNNMGNPDNNHSVVIAYNKCEECISDIIKYLFDIRKKCKSGKIHIDYLEDLKPIFYTIYEKILTIFVEENRNEEMADKDIFTSLTERFIDVLKSHYNKVKFNIFINEIMSIPNGIYTEVVRGSRYIKKYFNTYYKTNEIDAGDIEWITCCIQLSLKNKFNKSCFDEYVSKDYVPPMIIKTPKSNRFFKLKGYSLRRCLNIDEKYDSKKEYMQGEEYRKEHIPDTSDGYYFSSSLSKLDIKTFSLNKIMRGLFDAVYTSCILSSKPTIEYLKKVAYTCFKESTYYSNHRILTFEDMIFAMYHEDYINDFSLLIQESLYITDEWSAYGTIPYIRVSSLEAIYNEKMYIATQEEVYNMYKILKEFLNYVSTICKSIYDEEMKSLKEG